MRFLLSLLFLLPLVTNAQQKAITMDNVWKTYDFIGDRVSGFNFLSDGRSYARLENNEVVRYDIATGDKSGTLVSGFDGQIDDYEFSEDEGQVLISSESEQLFRRSSQSFYYVYDLDGKTTTPVYPDKKHRLATLDPTGQRVAFVVDNNIWIKELRSGDVTQVTDDGVTNEVINGAADWVYEEEFAFSKAIYWSPDGKRLAYLKFDEKKVPEFTYTDFKGGMYPEYNTFKYPKVGEENSTVSLHVYTLQGKNTQELERVNKSAEDKWHYIPRVQWTTEANELTALRMNRHQSEAELLLFDLSSGDRKTLLTEKNKYYIDVHDNLTFLPGGKQFIWASEMEGFNQLYLYQKSGGTPLKITQGNFDVTNFYGYNPENGRVYYQAAARTPMQREVYSKSLKGKDMPIPLAAKAGVNDVQFSDTYDYFVLTHSTINQPSQVMVMDENGEVVREIVDNAALTQRMTDYGFQPVEFFTFTTERGDELNGYLIKPANQRPGQQYPLLMHVYGGPGSQQVMDNWRGQNMIWFQMMAQRGYAIAVVDNRGTGARGEEFKKQTYLQLGKLETEDQISAARHLGGMDFIDADKIAIFGWSYGGFMALHSILQGNDVFAAAISVAPVTNWKWYDSIYTERYMRTYAENKDGYDDNSPTSYADRLKGRLLLVHGMGDDNVHFQHTAEMAEAFVMNNKQYDTYFYPNRNHGIYGGPTRLHLYTKMTDFLDDAIGPDSKPKVAELDVVPGDN